MVHSDTVMLVIGACSQRVHAIAAHAWVVFADNPITIDQFFTNLYGKLTGIALALSTFFFAWSAILYGAAGTGNERTKQHAQSALYAALVGLALALLAGVVAGLINTAAAGK